jgi:hypothetical protein
VDYCFFLIANRPQVELPASIPFFAFPIRLDYERAIHYTYKKLTYSLID